MRILIATLSLALISGCGGKKDDSGDSKAQKAPTQPVAKTQKTPTQPVAKKGPAETKEKGDKPEIKTDAAKCPDGKAPRALKAGETIEVDHFDERPFPRCVLWQTGGASVVLTVVDKGEEEEGELSAWVNGKRQRVDEYWYNLATGGSMSWRLDGQGRMAFINDIGGSGSDAGTLQAMLMTFDAATQTVKIVEKWDEDILKDPPAWADLRTKGGGADKAAQP